MTNGRWFGRSTVITPHHLASGVGAEILAAGGNAVDAVVAANLALGVVAPYYCGVGGDLLAMVWDGGVQGYRSVGRSPAGATADVVRALNGESALILPFGPASVSVPGAVRGWFDLLDRWGTKSFAELAAPAVRLAAVGFPLSRPGAFRVAGSAALCDAFVDDAEALMSVYGGVEEGDLLVQPALAGTLELLGRDGPDAYYRGPIAASIAAELQRRGWPMTLADLADHEAAWVDPIFGRFGDLDVAELPPPTQGVTALQMLAIADGLDLGSDDVDRLHLLIEVSKIGLAERDVHVGDPDHMTLGPADLLDPQRVERLRAEIDPTAASRIGKRPQPDGGTAYLCAADRDGLAVSLIQSNFTAIGSGVHVAEWGINLHNRGSAFTLEESSPNGFAGGKLPMHTLIPALGLRDGRLALVFGTMGGQAQAPIHLQVLTRMVHDRSDAQDAIDAPRFETDPASGRVGIEARVDPAWTSALVSRGHDVNLLRAYDDGVGHAHAIEVHPNGFRVGADPRAESAAVGT
jgi:gamma-glutamyltranspeptidase / glutathione hydrolase